MVGGGRDRTTTCSGGRANEKLDKIMRKREPFYTLANRVGLQLTTKICDVCNLKLDYLNNPESKVSLTEVHKAVYEMWVLGCIFDAANDLEKSKCELRQSSEYHHVQLPYMGTTVDNSPVQGRRNRTA